MVWNCEGEKPTGEGCATPRTILRGRRGRLPPTKGQMGDLFTDPLPAKKRLD